MKQQSQISCLRQHRPREPELIYFFSHSKSLFAHTNYTFVHVCVCLDDQVAFIFYEDIEAIIAFCCFSLGFHIPLKSQLLLTTREILLSHTIHDDDDDVTRDGTLLRANKEITRNR